MLQQPPSPAANARSPSPAGSSSSKPTLSPSPLSQPYSSQTFAGNSNFTFLQGYTTNITGKPGTLQYTVQLINTTTGANISAWHDIPLDLTVAADGSVTFNTLVEIPTGEQAKYETMVSAVIASGACLAVPGDASTAATAVVLVVHHTMVVHTEAQYVPHAK
jgi:hypothetical protein